MLTAIERKLLKRFHSCRYQPPLANREDVHAYETPSAVYEQLNEDRPLHEYNIASQYEEINTTAIDVYSIENRNSYEKVSIFRIFFNDRFLICIRCLCISGCEILIECKFGCFY